MLKQRFMINSDSDSDNNKPLIDFKKNPLTPFSRNSDSDSDDDKPLVHLKENAQSDNRPFNIDLSDSNDLVGSDSDDYETNMPLAEFKLYDTIPERSPVALRVREKVGSIESETPPLLLNLDDYENPKVGRPIKKKNKKACHKKVTEELMISGIQPLSRSAVLDSSNSSRKSVTIPQTESSSIITNIGGRRFISTPKRDDVPNISQMSLHGLSPIPHSSKTMPKVSPHVRVKNIRIRKKTNNNYFKSPWINLQKEFMSCLTFKQLRKKIENQESNLPPLPQLFGDYSVALDEVDIVARLLVPPDTPENFRSNDYVPVEVQGDGNCFFRALSRLVYGDEQYHLEMRCRIIMDCVKNIDKYTNHDYLMRGVPYHAHKKCPNIASIYCAYSGVGNVDDRDLTERGIIDVFKENTLRIREDKKYCDIWHFHSAANVLNRKIWAIFPQQGNFRSSSRVDFNRAFLPNTPNLKNEFCLMWTSVTDPPVLYNHIVPIVKRYMKNIILKLVFINII